MNTREDTPIIGEFDKNEPLILEPAPNGGWVIRQRGFVMGDMGKIVGAYTHAEDMLNALGDTLAGWVTYDSDEGPGDPTDA